MKTLAGNGFNQTCDWHSQQKVVERAGDEKLKEFDSQTEQNWTVSPLFTIICH